MIIRNGSYPDTFESDELTCAANRLPTVTHRCGGNGSDGLTDPATNPCTSAKEFSKAHILLHALNLTELVILKRAGHKAFHIFSLHPLTQCSLLTRHLRHLPMVIR